MAYGRDISVACRAETRFFAAEEASGEPNCFRFSSRRHWDHPAPLPRGSADLPGSLKTRNRLPGADFSSRCGGWPCAGSGTVAWHRCVPAGSYPQPLDRARGEGGGGGALVLKRNQTLGSSKGFCLTSYTVCLVPTRERRHFLLGGVSKCKGDRPLSTTDRRLPQVPTLEIFARAPMTELQ